MWRLVWWGSQFIATKAKSLPGEYFSSIYLPEGLSEIADPESVNWPLLVSLVWAKWILFCPKNLPWRVNFSVEDVCVCVCVCVCVRERERERERERKMNRGKRESYVLGSTMLKRPMHPRAHCSPIHNSQDVGTTKCPSTEEWVRKIWYMEYNSAIKKVK